MGRIIFLALKCFYQNFGFIKLNQAQFFLSSFFKLTQSIVVITRPHVSLLISTVDLNPKRSQPLANSHIYLYSVTALFTVSRLIFFCLLGHSRFLEFSLEDSRVSDQKHMAILFLSQKHFDSTNFLSLMFRFVRLSKGLGKKNSIHDHIVSSSF